MKNKPQKGEANPVCDGCGKEIIYKENWHSIKNKFYCIDCGNKVLFNNERENIIHSQSLTGKVDFRANPVVKSMSELNRINIQQGRDMFYKITKEEIDSLEKLKWPIKIKKMFKEEKEEAIFERLRRADEIRNKKLEKIKNNVHPVTWAQKPKECKHEWRIFTDNFNTHTQCKLCGIDKPVESRDEKIGKLKAGKGINSAFTYEPLESALIRFEKKQKELEQRLDELEKFNNTRFAVNYVDITQLETRLEKLEKSNKKKHEQTN